jgi:hypothetical protein
MESSRFYLACKFKFPVSIHLNKKNTLVIRRDFHALFVKGGYLAAFQLADKKPELEDHILSRTRLIRCCNLILRPATIITCEEHHSKASILGVIFKLLNDGSALVCLFVKDNNLQAETFQEASDCFADRVVSAVYEEDCIPRWL